MDGNGSSEDELLTLLAGLFALVLLGPALLANFIPAAQGFLLGIHVLVQEAVLIPIGTGAGLDLARAFIGLGALALLGVLVLIVLRRRSRRSVSDRGRA